MILTRVASNLNFAQSLQLLEEMSLLEGDMKEYVAKSASLYSSSEIELGFAHLTDLLNLPAYAKFKEKFGKKELKYLFESRDGGEVIFEKAVRGNFKEIFDYFIFTVQKEAISDGELLKLVNLAYLLINNIKEIVHVVVLIGNHYFRLKINIPTLIETVFTHSNPEALAKQLEKKKATDSSLNDNPLYSFVPTEPKKKTKKRSSDCSDSSSDDSILKKLGLSSSGSAAEKVSKTSSSSDSSS